MVEFLGVLSGQKRQRDQVRGAAGKVRALVVRVRHLLEGERRHLASAQRAVEKATVALANAINGVRWAPRQRHDEVTRFVRAACAAIDAAWLAAGLSVEDVAAGRVAAIDVAYAMTRRAEDAIPSFASASYKATSAVESWIDAAPTEASFNATLAELMPDLTGAALRDLARAVALENPGRLEHEATKRWEKTHARALGSPESNRRSRRKSRNVK